MPTSEERVTTLEEIVRNHDAQLQRQQRSVELLTTLAENSTRVQQQIVQTMEALTTRFGQVEETNRLLVTGMEALQGGMGALQTEMRAVRTEMGEFRSQIGVWAQTVEQRFDALPGIIARVVTDEVRPIATELRSVNSMLHTLPEALAKAVAEEFRPLLSLREDVEALKRRVEALEKKQPQ